MEELMDLYDCLDKEPTSIHLLEKIDRIWKEMGEGDTASGIATTFQRSTTNLNPTIKCVTKHDLSSKTLYNSEDLIVPLTHSQPLPKDWKSAQEILRSGYTSLKLEAQLLQEEALSMTRAGLFSLEVEEMSSQLNMICEGKVSSAVPMHPMSVRVLARGVGKDFKKNHKLIVADFEDFVTWNNLQTPAPNLDAIRERLVKREQLLEAVLPSEMTPICKTALAFVERKFFCKKYVNNETMLGDNIEDIPPDRILVTEDNYIWDMEELTQAIQANGGTMRNPLSRHMFTILDIQMILAHPIGKVLKAIHSDQAKMKNGVRSDTITRIRELGDVMKNFQDIDTTPLRMRIDEFEGHCLTLSEDEQKTLRCLKIPAVDGFSSQAFDYTISQSIQDAKANTTCFHKVGDFLWQAAAYLQKN